MEDNKNERSFVNPEPIENAAEQTAPKVRRKKPTLRAILAAAVMLLVVILTVFAGSRQKETPVYALYIKDGELFYTGLGKDDAWQISEELRDPDMDALLYHSSLNSPVGMAVTVSSDGKLMFYPEQLDRTDEMTLYVRKLNDPDAEAVRIDREILQYAVSEDAAVVNYTKVGSGNLYRYTMKTGEKSKLAGDVEEFFVSPDGKTILYRSDDADLCLLKGSAEKETLDTCVTSIRSVSEDLKTVYYQKEDTLFKLKIGGEPELIADHLYSIAWIYDSGEIYYIREVQTEKKLSACIEDDLAASDAAMVQPERPETPVRENYISERSYEKAFETYQEDLAAYEAACTDYEEKQLRDELRWEMDDKTIYVSTYTLCFYDGSASVVLSENYATYGFTPTMNFEMPQYVYGAGAPDKVKISRLDNIHNAENEVLQALRNWDTAYIARGAEVFELDMSNPCGFAFSEDGKTMWYMDNIGEDNQDGELYRMDISGKKVGRAQLYDTDVYAGWNMILDNDSIAYLKELENQCGELYIDKKQVDYDVQLWNIRLAVDGKGLLYYRDWSVKPKEEACGTLMLWNGKKTETVGTNVSDYQLLEDGSILFLSDFEWEQDAGELYLWDGGRTVQLDEDVNAIVRLFGPRLKQLVY